MREFELIEQLRRKLPASKPGVTLGIGDDAALLQAPSGATLAVCTDTLNEGVHFLPDHPPAELGHKSLAVNLSDLAAMGASPRWALLNLSLPAADESWLEEFTAGFLSLAERYGLALVGGDTTRGPRSITVTLMGDVPEDQALRRDGAAAGELIVVSGTPGLARLALQERRAGRPVSTAAYDALHRPPARLELGLALRGWASACIDLSDGLLPDLGHLAQASGLGARLALEALPVASDLSTLEAQTRWELQLQGGDDYELCFTLAPDRRNELPALSQRLQVPLTVIGEMTDAPGICLLDAAQNEFLPSGGGWSHFAEGAS